MKPDPDNTHIPLGRNHRLCKYSVHIARSHTPNKRNEMKWNKSISFIVNRHTQCNLMYSATAKSTSRKIDATAKLWFKCSAECRKNHEKLKRKREKHITNVSKDCCRKLYYKISVRCRRRWRHFGFGNWLEIRSTIACYCTLRCSYCE